MTRLLPDPRQLLDAALRPATFVRRQPPVASQTSAQRFNHFVGVSVFFATNLLLYAVPIGMSFQGRYSTVTFLDQLGYVSGLFVMIAGAGYWGVYLVLWVTRTERDVLAVFQTIVYSTGVYLAFLWGFVFPILAVGGFGTAIQTAAVPLMEVIEANLGQPSGYTLTGTEISVGNVYPPSVDFVAAIGDDYPIPMLVILALGVGYYLYSLYLGTRIHHGASRTVGCAAAVSALLGPWLLLGVFILPWEYESALILLLMTAGGVFTYGVFRVPE